MCPNPPVFALFFTLGLSACGPRDSSDTVYGTDDTVSDESEGGDGDAGEGEGESGTTGPMLDTSEGDEMGGASARHPVSASTCCS